MRTYKGIGMSVLKKVSLSNSLSYPLYAGVLWEVDERTGACDFIFLSLQHHRDKQ